MGLPWLKSAEESDKWPPEGSTIVCSRCGSADLSIDATASWDEVNARFVLLQALEDCVCEHCRFENEELLVDIWVRKAIEDPSVSACEKLLNLLSRFDSDPIPVSLSQAVAWDRAKHMLITVLNRKISELDPKDIAPMARRLKAIRASLAL